MLVKDDGKIQLHCHGYWKFDNYVGNTLNICSMVFLHLVWYSIIFYNKKNQNSYIGATKK